MTDSPTTPAPTDPQPGLEEWATWEWPRYEDRVSGAAEQLPNWVRPQRLRPREYSPSALVAAAASSHAWSDAADAPTWSDRQACREQWGVAALRMGQRTLARYRLPRGITLTVGIRALAGRLSALAVVNLLLGPGPDDPDDPCGAQLAETIESEIWPHGRRMMPATPAAAQAGRALWRHTTTHYSANTAVENATRTLARLAMLDSRYMQPALGHLYRHVFTLAGPHGRGLPLARALPVVVSTAGQADEQRDAAAVVVADDERHDAQLRVNT